MKILGIDGASPTLLEKWRNDLQNLQRLSDKGTTGLTIPPIPPQTPVA
ncbi:MAG: alkaline phosphatase family protein [Thermoplasmata archaeon]